MTEFRDIYDLAFRNETNVDIPAKFRFKRPDAFKKNCNSKKIRVTKFTTNNKYIPLFVSDQTDAVYDPGNFYGTIPNATTSNLIVDNNIGINSTNYFIIIRRNGNTKALIIFIEHVPEDPALVAPTSIIYDKVPYYSEQYYYYHDLTHFFSILESAINDNFNSLAIAAPADAVLVDPTAKITVNPTNNTFSIFINKLYLDLYQIEFSQSLIDIFPFKNSISQYTAPYKSFVIIFSGFEATSGTMGYRLSSCAIYDIVFPFSEFLISSEDLGVNFTKFITNEDFVTNGQQASYESTILAYNIRSTEFINIYDLYEYTNNNDSLWNNFYLDSSTTGYITIELKLRFKNGVIIPFKLKRKELFTMSLEVKQDLIISD